MPAATDHRLIRALRAIAQSTAWRISIFAIIALVATKPLLSHAGEMNLFRDAQVLEQYEDAARISVVKHGQLPLWDPWYCGGMYGLGSPQSRFASPAFVFTLLFGTLRGQAVMVFLMIALGLEGAFRYARARGGTSFAAMLAAPAFALSGAFATAPAMGWINFMGFELLPWTLFGLRRAMQGKRWGIALFAGSLAWMVGMGGTYTAPIAALFCAFDVSWELGSSWRDRDRMKRIAWMAAACAACALLLSAFRLWPVLETLRMSPRVIGGAPANTGIRIFQMLTYSLEKGKGAGDFDGGTFYVGAPLAVLLFAAFYGKRNWPMMVAGFLAFWLAAGYAALPSLFDMLRGLPLYSTLRYPERFLIPFALCVTVLAANGITLFERAKGKWALFVTLLVLANVGMLVRNHHYAQEARELAPPPAEIDRDFHQARGNRWAAAMYAPMNRGSLSCWDAYPIPMSSALRSDLADEAYVVDANAGEVKTTRWTPNEISLEADLKSAARVRINQNWHPGWTTSEGTLVSEEGLIAIDLPPGKHAPTIRFRPRSGLGGVLVSIAALVVCAIFVIRKKAHPAIAFAPAIVLALVLVGWKEPPVPDRRFVTPSGDEVIADAPPEGAQMVNARFDHGIELVAVRVSNETPIVGSKVILELDWRVTKPIPDGVGIFVHIEPSKQKDRMGADHATISGVLELDRAPYDRILRDQIELGIADHLSGQTVTIYAGLWIMRGRGQRLSIIESGNSAHGPLTVSEDRLLITQLKVQ